MVPAKAKHDRQTDNGQNDSNLALSFASTTTKEAVSNLIVTERKVNTQLGSTPNYVTNLVSKLSNVSCKQYLDGWPTNVLNNAFRSVTFPASHLLKLIYLFLIKVHTRTLWESFLVDFGVLMEDFISCIALLRLSSPKTYVSRWTICRNATWPARDISRVRTAHAQVAGWLLGGVSSKVGGASSFTSCPASVNDISSCIRCNNV